MGGFRNIRQDRAQQKSAMRFCRLSAGLLAAALLFGSTAGANAQGAVRFDPWRLADPLDTPPGASPAMRDHPDLTAEDQPNVGLSVIVLKTADQKARLLRVLAPLGVLLPNGLGLNIDGKDMGRVAFVRCLPNGCVAEVAMDDKLLGQIRNAKTATFIIFQTPEEGIGFPVSLNGLAEGYDKLP